MRWSRRCGPLAPLLNYFVAEIVQIDHLVCWLCNCLLSPDTLWRLRTHDSLKMCVFSWNLQGSFLTPVFCRGFVQCLLLIVQHSQRCVGGLLVCAVFFLIWSMLPIFCSLCKTSHLMRLHPLDSEWLDQLVYYSVIAWWSIRSTEVHVSSLLFAFWT